MYRSEGRDGGRSNAVVLESTAKQGGHGESEKREKMKMCNPFGC
jgi:hypothetical protein